MLTVVTGWSPSGWKEYAHRFVETFERFWPKDVRCLCYIEKPQVLPARFEPHLLSEIPGCMEFLDRWRGDQRANGRQPTDKWKPAWVQAGYSFKFDAWKFSRQGFIPLAAAQHAGEYLCWLDADVVTQRAVPPGFVESLMPANSVVTYLGRHPKHSEIGFQLYRLPGALKALQLFSDLYQTDEVFSLKEWHSAYVFDEALRRSGVSAHSLTQGGSSDVFPLSPLGRYMVHLKGKRKYGA